MAMAHGDDGLTADNMEVRPRDDWGWRTLWLRNARLGIIGDELEFSARRRRSLRLPLPRSAKPDAASALVLAFVQLRCGGGRRLPYRKLLVVNASGRTMASVQALRRRYYGSWYGPPYETVWPNDDLSRLSEAAGLEYREEEFADTMALQRAYPGAMKGYRFYTHPNRYMLLAALAVIALVAATIFIANPA